jgi:hypothetical protein
MSDGWMEKEGKMKRERRVMATLIPGASAREGAG